jgi:hypothetical protein
MWKMSQALDNTTMILIGLVMLTATLIYNYTIVAEHLDDESGWKLWTRMRLYLAERWGQ